MGTLHEAFIKREREIEQEELARKVARQVLAAGTTPI
jgi:hypothetical protein